MIFARRFYETESSWKWAMKFIVANSPPSKGFFIEAFKLTDQVCLALMTLTGREMMAGRYTVVQKSYESRCK